MYNVKLAQRPPVLLARLRERGNGGEGNDQGAVDSSFRVACAMIVRHKAGVAFAATVFANAPPAYGADNTDARGTDLNFSGYYKNLLIKSDTVFPGKEPYTLDLNRLRLELKGKVSEAIALDIQYDNEVLLGSYLHTAQFQMQKDQMPDQYWKGQANYAETNSYYGQHRLYRGSITASSGETDVRIGRQRIAWGTGRFWSPLDILNPFSPIQLEREERVGVDAVLVEHKLGPLSRVSAVYAPQHNRSDSSTALQWHGNAAGVDYSVVGGRFRGERVVGLDVASQIGDAGIRAELTSAQRDAAPDYSRAVAGLDYAFPNTLTLSGEFYYNGAGASDTQTYDFASLFAGRIQNLARRYVGAYAGYEITPLIKWNNYLVTNLFDHSRYFLTSLIYSIKTNLDWAVGVQFFRGGNGSEYGRFNDVYFTQLQWFF